jgi:predicted ATPase
MAREYRNPNFLYFGSAILGAAQATQGQLDEGIEDMTRAIDTYRALPMTIWHPVIAIALVEAYAARNDVRKGLDAIAYEIDLVAQSGEHAWDAEIKRWKGELLSLDTNETAAAEVCFEEALRIARSQRARSLELRAATSLAELWHRHGRDQDAHALLAPVYDWFTEGFDTCDLKEAKALLEKTA